MKYSKHLIIFSFVAVITVIACKTKKETKTVVVEEKPITGPVTYETLQPLLSKSCNTSGCHDESRRRMNFKVYANLKSFGERGEIKEHVLEMKNMPPNERLTANELAMFRLWIEGGMLEK